MKSTLERFQKYYAMYQKMIISNAAKFVDHSTAEDVAQEAFLRLHVELEWMPEERVKPWLLVVSANIARDILKKGGSRKAYVQAPEEFAKREPVTNTLEDYLETKAASELCLTALGKLYEKNPNWYYIIIDQVYMERTAEESAEALGLTVGNVNTIRHRARAYLKKELGDEYGTR